MEVHCSLISYDTRATPPCRAAARHRTAAPSPQVGEEAAVGPSVQELSDAQDGVDQQDELEEEREVVREPGARRVENHGDIGEVCSPSQRRRAVDSSHMVRILAHCDAWGLLGLRV